MKVVMFTALSVLLINPAATFGQVIMTNHEATEKVFPIINDLAIPENDLPHLENEAIEGSPDAALRLHLYYEVAHVDLKKSLFWARIAAENGSPVGQYDLGLKLQNNPDSRSRKRGNFWLKRAAENGHERALELINKLPR